jgi:hypothetical protein
MDEFTRPGQFVADLSAPGRDAGSCTPSRTVQLRHQVRPRGGRGRPQRLLEPAVVTRVFHNGNITRHPESHFLDLVVNGRRDAATSRRPALR